MIQYTIQKDCTIREAMEKIENNYSRSLIVLDKKKVVGVISDGTIRKHLLKNGILETKVEKIMVTDFLYAESKLLADSILINTNDIFLVPIVDKKMKLITIERRRHDR